MRFGRQRLLIVLAAGWVCLAGLAPADVWAGDFPVFTFDPVNSGLLTGTGLGYWNGDLWGLDPATNSVWAYDGSAVSAGGAIPAGLELEGYAWYTDHGMYVTAYSGDIVQGPEGDSPRVWTHILKSDDGFSSFQTVHEWARAWQDHPRYSSLARSLADLGGGEMMYFDYCGNSRAHYSPDGVDWDMLFDTRWWMNKDEYTVSTTDPAIRHFHGAVYDSDYQTLYVMTGDPDPQPTILFCDELWGPNGLIQDPELWKMRWGLREGGRPNLDTDYILHLADGTATTQQFRAVDLFVHGDYIYWGQDKSNAAGTMLSRAHRVTHEVEEIALGDHIVGIVWQWFETADGHVLFLTVSDVNDKGEYRPNNDEYLRIYALSDDGTDVEEIFKIRREDWMLPQFGTHDWWWGVTEAFGEIWLSNDSGFEGFDGVLAGHVIPEPATMTLMGLGLVSVLLAGSRRSGHRRNLDRLVRAASAAAAPRTTSASDAGSGTLMI